MIIKWKFGYRTEQAMVFKSLQSYVLGLSLCQVTNWLDFLKGINNDKI